MPPQFRAVADISRFVSRLLQEKPSDCVQTVQRISLPRHHLDKPDSRPKCKGFALVTLARMEDADFLVQRWPWQRHTEKSADASDDMYQDAARFGFRTTRKAHWDELNAEYLAYRQTLLDELALTEQNEQVVTEPSRTSEIPEVLAAREKTPESHNLQTSILDLSTPYPPGCLAYARNVHLETNKTTLRKLFSQGFAESNASTAGGGIDYVDFNKGMDTVSRFLVLCLQRTESRSISATCALPPQAILRSSCGIFRSVVLPRRKVWTASELKRRTGTRNRSLSRQ